MTDFASYLRKARKDAGLNQSELAGMVGLTGSYLSVLESRKKPPPSDAVLRRLARALSVPESEILEVAHLDRSPDDIRHKIRSLDRHLRVQRKLASRLLTDLLPSSLWHFGRVQGFHESALEKLRLDARRKRVLRSVLSRLGPLTNRDGFEARIRREIDSLRDEERAVLLEVIPELAREPESPAPAPTPSHSPMVPLLATPPEEPDASPGEVLDTLPVAAADYRPGRYFLAAPDGAMAPRVEAGDRLLVAPDRAPRPGDLVLARIDGAVTLRQAAAGGDSLLLVAGAGRAAPVAADPGTVLGVIAELRRTY